MEFSLRNSSTSFKVKNASVTNTLEKCSAGMGGDLVRGKFSAKGSLPGGGVEIYQRLVN
jgi:hypothetical protein